MNGLTEVKGTRCLQPQNDDVEILDENSLPAVNGGAKLLGAVADNFGTILAIADKIVSIRGIREQSEADARLLAAEQERLRAEADAYAVKKNADTNSVIGKLNVLRDMMKDFNNSSNPNMTAEQFQETMRLALELAER